MKFFPVVNRDVAKNPIARAIAKKRTESAIRDHVLSCYTLQEGADAAGEYLTTTEALNIARILHERHADPEGQERIAELMDALKRASERGFAWSVADAYIVDEAMQAVLELVKTSSADELMAAWDRVGKGLS